MPAINERLLDVVKYYGKNISQFVEAANNRLPEERHLYQQKFGRPFALDKRSEPYKYPAVQVDDLVSVFMAFPDVSMDWVLLGNGEMIKSNIEVTGLDNSSTNSDQPDLSQSPDLKHLVEHQKKLLQKVEQIGKAVGDLKKDSDKVLLLLAQSKTAGTGNKKGKVE